MIESIHPRATRVPGRAPRVWPKVRPAVLAIAGLLAMAPIARAADFAEVLRVVGPVEVRHAKVWSPARVGTELDPGDAIRTDDQGYATIRDHGAVTDLYPLTTLEITADSQLSITVGRIWSHFLHVLGVPREIRAPDAVAMIRGTTLSVGVSSAKSDVTVLEGHVVVQAISGASEMVNGGFAVGVDHGVLGSVVQANPVLLDQGREFLEQALPLMPGVSAAPGGSAGRLEARQGMRSPHRGAGMAGRGGAGDLAPPGGAPVAREPGTIGGPSGPRAMQWHMPDAEQRAESEWDEHRLGPMGFQRAPGQPMFGRADVGREVVGRDAVGRRGFPAQNAPMGLFQTGPVPPMMGGAGPVGDLSVERMERPAGVVLPNGRPMEGPPLESGMMTTGGSDPTALPEPVQAPETRDGSTVPISGTTQTQLSPDSGPVGSADTLPQGTGGSQTK